MHICVCVCVYIYIYIYIYTYIYTSIHIIYTHNDDNNTLSCYLLEGLGVAALVGVVLHRQLAVGLSKCIVYSIVYSIV